MKIHHGIDIIEKSRIKKIYQKYGIKFLKREKEWYRRYLRKDFSIFKEVFDKWGNETKDINIGTVALCKSNNGFGLAVYYEKGWISCGESEVRWSPLNALEVVGCYSPQKSNYVKQ